MRRAPDRAPRSHRARAATAFASSEKPVSPPMAKRTKSLPKVQGFVLFDVTYADGSRASNRRVPAEILGGLDGDEPARVLIGEQEEEIARKSGRPKREIERLMRSPAPSSKPDL
jgi:hypothetical protein